MALSCHHWIIVCRPRIAKRESSTLYRSFNQASFPQFLRSLPSAAQARALRLPGRIYTEQSRCTCRVPGQHVSSFSVPFLWAQPKSVLPSWSNQRNTGCLGRAAFLQFASTGWPSCNAIGPKGRPSWTAKPCHTPGDYFSSKQHTLLCEGRR
jgi:hypothetical protein